MEDIITIVDRLGLLQANVPETEFVSKEYVDEYHALLSRLEKLSGRSLTEYYIPTSALKHTSGVFRPGVGFTGFGDPRPERGFFMLKLDSLLHLFSNDSLR